VPATIDLELSLPDFMTAETQPFTVCVNHRLLDETYSLDNGQGWVQMRLQLPYGLLKQGNNLITLKFSKTANPQDRSDWRFDWNWNRVAPRPGLQRSCRTRMSQPQTLS